MENKLPLEKLPKWAQEHIHKLELKRDAAVDALNAFTNQSKPSPFFFEKLPCTGEDVGPSFKRAYIQTSNMEVLHAGVSLRIYLGSDGIELSWGDGTMTCNHTAFVPTSFQRATLISKKNMR